MRLCYEPGCDEAAAVWDHGAYCGTHALARIERAKTVNTVPLPLGTGNPPSGGFPSSGEGPRRAASVGGVSPPPLSRGAGEAIRTGGDAGPDSPSPALPSFDELAAILEADGWHEVEFELITRHGMTLNDLARRLAAEIEATV